MRGHVVVTGASTGIGEATALHLDSLGFSVFAGIRKPEDGERVTAKGSERLRSLRIDVTDEASIEAAAEEVRAAVGSTGLAGLVNNAGVAVSGPIEHVPVEDFRQQLEVNLVGQVAVIQAFLPMLRAAHGRIVNVSSIGGRIALPLAGPYAASKFGLEAVSDSLRRELGDQGIEVVVVEPGGVKTPIWEKGTATADRIAEGLPAEAEQHYGRLTAALRKESEKIAEKTGLPPSAVAETIGKAMTAGRPRTRYLVGRDAKLRDRLARNLPDRAFDALLARALR